MAVAALLPGRKNGFRLRVSHNSESGPPCSEGRFGVSSGSSFGDRFGGLFSTHFWVGWEGSWEPLLEQVLRVCAPVLLLSQPFNVRSSSDASCRSGCFVRSGL